MRFYRLPENASVSECLKIESYMEIIKALILVKLLS